jgi:hypothetical protein
VDKDKHGDITLSKNEDGNYVDNNDDLINDKGYLIDEEGNVIDKEYRIIFEKRHLESNEIPKLFPFTKFNEKSVKGSFEVDEKGIPILKKDKSGYKDDKGKVVNLMGNLIDK